MYNMIIVDDESFELDLISSWTIWKEYNIQITATFERPQDALAYILKNKVDIILSDICMSNMSGIDFLKHIKIMSPDIIFVFVTAHNNFEYMHTAIVNNAFDYIMKPLHISDMKNLCERICEKLSVEASDNEPNSPVLKCNQALLDYFSDKLSVSDMQKVFLKNGIDFTVNDKKTCIIQLEIPEFENLRRRWHYGIDRLYASFINISKNSVFDIVPIKYNADTIDYFAIVHDEQKLSQELSLFISNCSFIFNCSFSYKLLSDIVFFSELCQSPAKILIIPDSDAEEKDNTPFSIKLALKYIEEHFSDDVSLNALAEHISLSPSHTSRLFKQYTGDSFVNYINKYRINKAKELLLTTNKTVREIGAEIGFSGKNYFTSLFRNYTGSTPTEYRSRYSD